MPKSLNKSLVICVYFVLTLVTLSVFWQVHNFDFVNYDDNLYVYENPQVPNGLNLDSIIWAFTTGHSANWHPLTWLSLMLDYQLFGLNPGWFHLENVFIHIANALLLFIVLHKMTEVLWPSVFVAAAFALHPMHVQSVAWIAERKDVLSTLFWMLTILAYIGFIRHRSIARYFLALVFFALGLMAKPMLVTLPFVLLLLDYWPLNRFALFKPAKSPEYKIRKPISDPVKSASLRQIIIEKIPFLVLAAISSIITYLVQQSGGAVVGSSALGLAGRLANAAVSYVRYIGKLFWPQNLTVFYPFNLGGFEFWQVALSIFLLFVVSVLVIRFGKKYKYLPIGWFWFVGTLIPVIGLVQVGEQAMADRYTYIPYIGLFIIIAWGLPQLLDEWRYRKITLSVSMLIIFSVLGMCSYQQVGYWKNNFTLFSHAAEVTQNNYFAYSWLGDEFRKGGDLTHALENYKRAVQIAPNYANAVLGLGSALADKGDLDQAMLYFEKTLQLKTDPAWKAAVHNNIAVALRNQGKLDEAIAHFRESILLKPDSAQSRNSFAKALILKGRLEDAQMELKTAIKLKPDWVEPMNILALLIATHPELKNRDVNQAIGFAKRACELTNYSNPATLGTLAAAYAAAGQFSDAIDIANKAIALADALNQPQIKKVIQYHLSFYMRGEPYIEPALKP